MTVKNAASHAILGASVQFTVGNNGGASATFPGGATTVSVVTAANGIATPPVLTANGTGGIYALTIAARVVRHAFDTRKH